MQRRPSRSTSRHSLYSFQKTKNAYLQVFHGASRTRTGDLLGAIQPSSHVESASFAALYGRAPGAPQHLPQQSAPRLAEARDPEQAAGAIEKERRRAPPWYACTPSKKGRGSPLWLRKKCQVPRTRGPTGLDAATLTRSGRRRQAMRDRRRVVSRICFSVAKLSSTPFLTARRAS